MADTNLHSVTYLAAAAISPRTAQVFPYWDGRRWSIWIGSSGGLREMHPIDVATGAYVGQHKAKATDLHVPFLEFLWQRASWPAIGPIILSLADDVRTIGTVLAKCEYFEINRAHIGPGARHFAATELEYLVTVCRRMFGPLQEAMSLLWEELSPIEDKRRQLPDRLARVILKAGAPRTAESISQDWLIPVGLAEAYVETGPFFLSLRRIRDRILHATNVLPLIFDTPRGFGIDIRDARAAEFFDRRPEYHFNDNVIALKPFVATIVTRTLNACDRLITALASQVEFPPPIAPGYLLFLRGYHDGAFEKTMRVLNGGHPWWADNDVIS